MTFQTQYFRRDCINFYPLSHTRFLERPPRIPPYLFSVEHRAWLCCDSVTGSCCASNQSWREESRRTDGGSPSSLSGIYPACGYASLVIKFVGKPSYEPAGRLKPLGGVFLSSYYETKHSSAAGGRDSRALPGCLRWRCVTSVCCVWRHRLTWLPVRQLTAVTAPSSTG